MQKMKLIDGDVVSFSEYRMLGYRFCDYAQIDKVMFGVVLSVSFIEITSNTFKIVTSKNLFLHQLQCSAICKP